MEIKVIRQQAVKNCVTVESQNLPINIWKLLVYMGTFKCIAHDLFPVRIDLQDSKKKKKWL